MSTLLTEFNDFNIEFDQSYRGEFIQLLRLFLYNLMHNNSSDTIKKLNFSIKNKEIHIDTRHGFLEENREPIKLILIGDEFSDELSNKTPQIIKQRVYTNSLSGVDNPKQKLTLVLHNVVPIFE